MRIRVTLLAMVLALLITLVSTSTQRDHIRREICVACADGCSLFEHSLARIMGDPDVVKQSGELIVATRACALSRNGTCVRTVAFRGSWLSPFTTWTFDIGVDGAVVGSYEHNMP
jgi:hypothetical protein